MKWKMWGKGKALAVLSERHKVVIGWKGILYSHWLEDLQIVVANGKVERAGGERGRREVAVESGSPEGIDTDIDHEVAKDGDTDPEAVTGISTDPLERSGRRGDRVTEAQSPRNADTEAGAQIEEGAGRSEKSVEVLRDNPDGAYHQKDLEEVGLQSEKRQGEEGARIMKDDKFVFGISEGVPVYWFRLCMT